MHASSAQPARPGFLNHDESSGPHQSCGTQQLMAHLRQTLPHRYPTLTSSPASPTYFLRADLAMRSSRVPFPDNRSPKPISLRAKTRLSFVNSAHPPPVPQISHPPEHYHNFANSPVSPFTGSPRPDRYSRAPRLGQVTARVLTWLTKICLQRKQGHTITQYVQLRFNLPPTSIGSTTVTESSRYRSGNHNEYSFSHEYD